MRDPKRIPRILATVMSVWSRHPDLRLGQLLLAAGDEDDLFYMEDDAIIRALCEKFPPPA